MSASNKASTGAFSFTTMLAMVLVGVVCLAGIALLSAFEPEMKTGNDGQAHALSKSSIGYLALSRLMDGAGFSVDLNRRGLEDGENDYDTVVLAPTPMTDADSILDFYRDGPTVIILPKWLAQRDKQKRGWAQLIMPLTTEDTFDILPADLRSDAKLTQAAGPTSVTLTYRNALTDDVSEFGKTKPIKSLRTISGSKWIPIITGPSGGAVIAKYKETNVYVVADPDIFNNAGMASLTNAKLAETFFFDIASEEGDTLLVFDLTLNGFQKTPNLGRLLVQPPLLGATLCLVLASILVAIQAAIRFLPPKEMTRAVALGKKGLADNTAGLLRMGGREHRMSLPYANVLKKLVMKAIGAPQGQDPVAQNAMLDRVSELSNSQLRYSNLVADASAAATPQELVKVAQDLHRWKQETTREHH
jgi:hypothetical protein